MAGTLKKVRLTVACGYGDVGFEFTPNGTTRDWLMERGWAKIVDDKPASFSDKAAATVGAVRTKTKNAKEAVKGLFQAR